MLILDVALFSRYGTDLVASFLYNTHDKHDLSGIELLVDQFSYRIAPLSSRTERSGQLYRADLLEKWFYTLKTRIGRFHNS